MGLHIGVIRRDLEGIFCHITLCRWKSARNPSARSWFSWSFFNWSTMRATMSRKTKSRCLKVILKPQKISKIHDFDQKYMTLLIFYNDISSIMKHRKQNFWQNFLPSFQNRKKNSSPELFCRKFRHWLYESFRSWWV